MHHTSAADGACLSERVASWTLWDSPSPETIDGGPGSNSLQLNSDAVNPKDAASTGTWDMASGAMTFTLDHEISLTVSQIEGAVLATDGTSWTVTGTAGDDSLNGATGGAPTSFDGLAGDDFFRGADGDDACAARLAGRYWHELRQGSRAVRRRILR